ncbi:hypothetical protein PIB30_049550 [Stylosanthes scabra]|uniref:Uncharacterized protein n=1 Tax=Stylosanthes scabra TaxID=79078 RepID=A0ABU6ZG47_9FABA|nr:hypothetical protein [Stylosanthes scabra]
MHTRYHYSFSRSHQPPTHPEYFGISSRRCCRRSRSVVSLSLTSRRRRCLKARSNLNLPCHLKGFKASMSPSSRPSSISLESFSIRYTTTNITRFRKTNKHITEEANRKEPKAVLDVVVVAGLLGS